jgi:hypothetical protein
VALLALPKNQLAADESDSAMVSGVFATPSMLQSRVFVPPPARLARISTRYHWPVVMACVGPFVLPVHRARRFPVVDRSI